MCVSWGVSRVCVWMMMLWWCGVSSLRCVSRCVLVVERESVNIREVYLGECLVTRL